MVLSISGINKPCKFIENPTTNADNKPYTKDGLTDKKTDDFSKFTLFSKSKNKGNYEGHISVISR